MTEQINEIQAIDENHVIAERREKLKTIRLASQNNGGVAFPNDFKPQHKAADLAAAHSQKYRYYRRDSGKRCHSSKHGSICNRRPRGSYLPVCSCVWSSSTRRVGEDCRGRAREFHPFGPEKNPGQLHERKGHADGVLRNRAHF
jgi:lysyl-tRNA synthetase class II